jgi:hypothetical protein
VIEADEADKVSANYRQALEGGFHTNRLRAGGRT